MHTAESTGVNFEASVGSGALEGAGESGKAAEVMRREAR